MHTIYYITQITAKINFSKSLLDILHCVLHFRCPVFVVACFVSMYNISICNWSGGKWLVFFFLCSMGIVWLTLPTFYSPVALSMCRSSRGNVLVCSPDPNLPGQASGCSHYPVASHPPPSPTITEYCTLRSHDSWPGCCCSLLIPLYSCAVPPHTGFHLLDSYVVEERCLND